MELKGGLGDCSGEAVYILSYSTGNIADETEICMEKIDKCILALCHANDTSSRSVIVSVTVGFKIGLELQQLCTL